METSLKKKNSKAVHRLWTRRYKCICLGEWSVGKSSIAKRFCDGTFSETYLPTIGCDFLTKIIKIENETIKLIIWDIAGQRLFASFRRDFYEGAQGALLIFDVTRPESLPPLKEWKEETLNVCGEIPFVICANKIDLESMISKIEAQKFAEKIDTPLIFTSAKTGENIEEAFTLLTEKMYKNEKTKP